MKNSVLCYLEESAVKYSDKTALVDEEGSITFGELRSKALIVANMIKAKVCAVKSPIMVYIPKSYNSIVAFMGILYTGNFYTPTDVNFPFAKVRGVIDQLNPILFVSQGEYVDKLVENGILRESIIDIGDETYEELSIEDSYLDKQIDTDLAYVFFTSGSTGVPKGVSITHRGIIDYSEWLVEEFKINETFVFGNQAPFYFDNSILDIYSMLNKGCTVNIIPPDLFMWPAKLMDYVKNSDINTIFWVPSALISVANSGVLEDIDCKKLKRIMFCGEVMPNKQLNIWRKFIPDAIYVNMYGPTEITDVCAYYVVNREFKDGDSLPIGRACRNTEIILLDDDNHRIVEPSVTGELCVRGSCLAVGYWNNPDKTNAVFVQNPLNSFYEEKIYRTGDIACYNEYGEIEFLGRRDFQIKYMGYRIELGEIETAALGNAAVENCCASFDKTENKIVMFYQGGISSKELKDYLKQVIPKYMVPGKYYCLDAFPYNDNGKIDRKKLAKEYLGG